MRHLLILVGLILPLAGCVTVRVCDEATAVAYGTTCEQWVEDQERGGSGSSGGSGGTDGR